MIISRTPFRVSFFGGGTDYPIWFKENGGEVISTTIDKYCYISCRTLPPFFPDHKYRFVYSKIESVQSINDIKHPSARAVLSEYSIDGAEIHHDGDLPARSGLGSSSSFTVGLLNVITTYLNKKMNKKQLANEAIRIEQQVIGETVGSQDQIAASYGGLNHIQFKKTGSFIVKPINISRSRIKSLEKKLMLFHTGIFRSAETVTKRYVKNFDKKIYYLQKINSIVDEAINILRCGKLDEISRGKK